MSLCQGCHKRPTSLFSLCFLYLTSYRLLFSLPLPHLTWTLLQSQSCQPSRTWVDPTKPILQTVIHRNVDIHCLPRPTKQLPLLPD